MSNDTNREIGRRNFLRIGSAGALSSALLLAEAPARGIAALSPDAEVIRSPQLVSVAYCRATTDDAMSGPRAPIAADRLTSGDARLTETGVRLSFRGLGAIERSGFLETCRSLAIAVDFQPFHPVSMAPLCYRQGAGAGIGCVASMIAPIDRRAGLNLVFESDGDAGRGCEELRFSTGSERGAMKLRRGVYLLAFAATPRAGRPRWQACEESASGWKANGFMHIAMEVESA